MFNISLFLSLCSPYVRPSGLFFCIGKAARSNRTRPGRENTLDNGEEDFHAPAYAGIGRIVTAGYFRSKISP